MTALLHESWGLVPGFAAGAAMPFLVLMRKRTVRFRRFEEQFPEALDLLSRAIKAGHALTTAMGMVADERADPIGPEFRKTFDEQNFGLSLKEALNNLATRVPSLDVRFFATAVLIQRETGGNLSEILDNLVLRRARAVQDSAPGARLHRPRPHDRIRAARLCRRARRRPDVHQSRAHEPAVQRADGPPDADGRSVMQTIGYVWIRKIVTIEV